MFAVGQHGFGDVLGDPDARALQAAEGDDFAPGSLPPRPVRTAAKFFQHGGRAEDTVFTEKKSGRLRRALHHVAAEAIHQARHVEVQ